MKETGSREVSEKNLKNLPNRSGVYLMKDAKGTVLYIGKARNLKSRVRSYFSGGDGRLNIPYLMQKVASVETLVTEDERQAIILEADLIRKYKPHYNVRLKDDKASLMVRVDESSDWPRLELVRKRIDDGSMYIGPYAFSYELRTLLEIVRQAVPLRTCPDRVLHNRVRPCLEYQIKRCAAPCCLEIDPEQYRHWVSQAVAILKGKDKEVALSMQKEMERASSELRFEEAAAIRDRLSILKKVGEDADRSHFVAGDRDAVSFSREGDAVEISVVMVRGGRLFEARNYGFSEVAIDDETMLSSFLSQYYLGKKQVPEEILLPIELEDSEILELLFSDINGKKVRISVPLRGGRKRLLDLARENAEENFEVRFIESGKQERALRELQRELSLEQMPRTIECVDISHFQGGETVASVVFFRDGVPDKNRYRRFEVRDVDKPDDFASMREIVSRHLSRCAEENTICDLMVIDGGTAQLSQAIAVRKELGLDKPELIGLAKKRRGSTPYRALHSRQAKPERVYRPDVKTPIVLKVDSPALYLLERLRDEAHRFAISFHRAKREKGKFRSVLEEVQGIGPKRRKELLREFGSVKAIRASSVEELVKRGKLPEALATRLLKRLSRS